MSIGRGQPHESHFGPTSELIDISRFIQSAWPESAGGRDAHGVAFAQSPADITGNAWLEWLSRSEDEKRDIIEECR